MKLTKPVAPLLTILPSIAYIPILIEIIKGSHLGGINIIFSFIISAINPSLDLLVLKSAWNGLQTTISIAIISWIISILLGILFGILSSDLFWNNYPNFSFIGKYLKRLLAIPRSIHEVIWGILFIQIIGLNISVAIIAIVIPYSALSSRVFSEQLDSFDFQPLISLKQTGSKNLAALITFIIPKLLPIFSTYGSYRLECAVRGATLLGIFGLGGIGTELYLSLKSMEFNEMWTSLWMLWLTIILLESFFKSVRSNSYTDINTRKYLINILFLFMITFTTILITILATGIAIGTPPLLLLFFPNKLSLSIQILIWTFFRLIPPPLTAILILLFTTPNISVAALSLGITNMGVMGRLLTDGLFNQSKDIYVAIKNNGSNSKAATLYGLLTPTSNAYLAYASYRADVILRETAIIGVVGGVGLGWQLQESLSSFDWSQVIVITSLFSLLTITGEFLCGISQNYWLRTSTNNFINL